MKQDNVTSTTTNAVNLFIAYKWDARSQDLNADFVLKVSFGDASLIKHDDSDKCYYSGYSMGFDSRSRYFQVLIEVKMEKVLNRYVYYFSADNN